MEDCERCSAVVSGRAGAGAGGRGANHHGVENEGCKTEPVSAHRFHFVEDAMAPLVMDAFQIGKAKVDHAPLGINDVKGT